MYNIQSGTGSVITYLQPGPVAITGMPFVYTGTTVIVFVPLK